VPTGAVSFTVNGQPQAPVALNSAGKAVLRLNTFAAGAYSISAAYLGDLANPPASSTAMTQIINVNTTTATITSSANPAVFGQAGFVTVTIAPVAPGIGAPTGSVIVNVDGTNESLPLVNGKATIRLSSLAVGEHPISAVYEGDANNGPSVTPRILQEIEAASTTTTLASSANPAAFGQNGTITATVRVVAPAVGTPTGTVTFTVDGVAQAPVSLAAGRATLSLAGYAVGTHTISAAYSGDATSSPSASDPFTETVNEATTTTTIATSRTPIKAGQSATITATVKAVAPATGTPTGTVTFTIDGVAQPPVGIFAGKAAILVTAALGSGSHTIVATYSGDGNYATSTSTTLTQVVS
jgi:hypothetical protein